MSRASTHTAYSTLFFLATLLLGAPLLPLPPTLARDRADLAAIRRLLRDERPSTRAAALRRLAGREDRPALDLVVAGLEDPHPYVRRAAAGVLGALDGEGIRPRLARRLRGAPHALVRQEACRTFALWADDGGGRALLESALDGDPGVRAEAVRWLSEVPGEESARALAVRLAHDPDGGVRALALDALAARPEAGPPLLPHLGDADERVRFSALEGSVARASSAGDADAAAVAVLRGLDDAVWSVRLRAAELAGGVKDRRLLPALVRRLEDPRQCVADAAHEALVRLTHIPFDPVPRVWLRWLAGDGASFDPAVADDAPSGRPRAPARPDEETVEAARFMGLPIRSRHVGFVPLLPSDAHRKEAPSKGLHRAS